MVVEGEVLVSHGHCVFSIGLHNPVDLHQVYVQEFLQEVLLLHHQLPHCAFVHSLNFYDIFLQYSLQHAQHAQHAHMMTVHIHIKDSNAGMPIAVNNTMTKYVSG